jgi:hypothetical protein
MLRTKGLAPSLVKFYLYSQIVNCHRIFFKFHRNNVFRFAQLCFLLTVRSFNKFLCDSNKIKKLYETAKKRHASTQIVSYCIAVKLFVKSSCDNWALKNTTKKDMLIEILHMDKFFLPTNYNWYRNKCVIIAYSLI